MNDSHFCFFFILYLKVSMANLQCSFANTMLTNVANFLAICHMNIANCYELYISVYEGQSEGSGQRPFFNTQVKRKRSLVIAALVSCYPAGEKCKTQAEDSTQIVRSYSHSLFGSLFHFIPMVI